MSTTAPLSIADLDDDERLEFHRQVNSLKEWFHRAGMANRRRFMLGLTQRLNEEGMMKYLVHLLNRVLGKDYTYTRSRTNPSLLTDNPQELSDHALSQRYIHDRISDTLQWFQGATTTTKSTFLFSLLGQCDVQLLHSIAHIAKTMVATEWAVKEMKDPIQRAVRPPSTVYTDPLGYTTRSTPDTNKSSPRHPQSLRVRSAPNFDIMKSPVDRPHSNTQDRLKSASSPGLGSERLTSADRNQQRPKSNQSRCSSRLSANPSTIYDQSYKEDIEEIATICGAKSWDTTYMVHSNTAKGYSGAWDSCDFIQQLPIHLAKYIISFLDVRSMKSGECVSRFWRLVVRQVRKEREVHQQVKDDSLLMQGGAAEGVNPLYANDIDVPVPVVDVNTLQVVDVDEWTTSPSNTTPYFYEGYKGQQTRNVIMEERNVFCGTYNVMIVIDKDDDSRVIHTDGDHLAIGTADRKIRLHDKTGRQFGPVIHGHAGTIRCLYLDHKRGYVLSGSYDTTIRHWSAENGECVRIYQGHQGTITGLRVCHNLMASASRDKSCKVWDLATGELLRTFRHQRPVTSVAVSLTRCVSGDESGVVKVWDHISGRLVKVLKGHTAAVTAITYDRWHIVTCSKDSFAFVWSNVGKHKRCLTTLRHQKAVLCCELLYLRVVTGSEDGRIRIWNALTGHCCRIMRGNSRSDPVLSLIVQANQITLNTKSNVIHLNFENVDWDYAMGQDYTPPMFTYAQYSDMPVKPRPHSYVRAKRMKISGTPSNLINRTCSRRVKSACTVRPLSRQKIKETLPKPRIKSAKTTRFEDEGAVVSDSKSVPKIELCETQRPDSDEPSDEIKDRRSSWGFDRVPTPTEESLDLKLTKALWRAQIRDPCQMYLSVDEPNKSRDRSNSGPPKIDPRLKTPIVNVQTDFGLLQDQKVKVDQKLMTNSGQTHKAEPGANPAKLESSKSKFVPKTIPIHIPRRPKTADQALLSCRWSLTANNNINSPFKDPLRLKQVFHLKTYEQETS